MVDLPSIFDETVEDIIVTKKKYCVVKSGTGTGKTQLLGAKIVKYGPKRQKVLYVLPTKEAVYNAYNMVSTNRVRGVNVDFKCGWAANSIIKYKNYKISLIRNVLYGDELVEPDDDDYLVFVTTGHFKRLQRDSLKYLAQDTTISPRTLGYFDYVIIDEAHLKTKNMDLDIIIRYLKYMIVSYPNKDIPKVICSSATYNENGVHEYNISGRTGFQTEILYIPMGNRTINERIASIPKGLYHILDNLKIEPGVVLVFLPGIKDINIVRNGLVDEDVMRILEIVIAHSSRTREQMQAEVFTPNTPGKWKIILATNIAETSLTIPDVKVIVDSCIENIRIMGANKAIFNQRQYISKDSADQRAGRVGRVGNGVVLRMLSPEEYEALPQTKVAEIDRLPISYELLQAIDCNVDIRFIFGDINRGINMSISDSQALRIDRTLKELKALGCIKECSSYFNVTQLGMFISSLTVTVKTGCLIYNAIMNGVDPYPVIVAACMIESAESLFEGWTVHDEFRSTVPLATLIKPWLKFCATFGNLKVNSKKLEDFCRKFKLSFDTFYDTHRKIMDCIHKSKNLIGDITERPDYEIEIYMFDPEDVFILIRPYLNKMYFKYQKKITGTGQHQTLSYVSTNPAIKHKPLVLSNRFNSSEEIYDRVISIMNVEMSGKSQMLVWYPDDYIPRMMREVEQIITSTTTIPPEEELIDAATTDDQDEELDIAVEELNLAVSDEL